MMSWIPLQRDSNLGPREPRDLADNPESWALTTHPPGRIIKREKAGFGGAVGCASDWTIRRFRVRPPPGRRYSFVEIDHETFSTVILSLPLVQEGQLSVSSERMCTILVNHLEDYACPVNVWLGKLTALNITPWGWLCRETSTQKKQGIKEKQQWYLYMHVFKTKQ